jgi:mannitol-1-/sugar-/sorbitol-6-phosphatase
VLAYVVAGAAGAGKSTLGRALAEAAGAVLLDLDVLTNPLLDAAFAALGGRGHWNDDRHHAAVRPARYGVLLDAASVQVSLGHDVVLVAPFTRELSGGPEWGRLVEAVAPAACRVVWLDAPPAVLAERRRVRGEVRDRADLSRVRVVPAVPHQVLDATLPTDEQVALVRQA